MLGGSASGNRAIISDLPCNLSDVAEAVLMSEFPDEHGSGEADVREEHPRFLSSTDDGVGHPVGARSVPADNSGDHLLVYADGVVATAFKERSELAEASKPEVHNLDLRTGVLIRDHEMPFGKDIGQQQLDVDGAEVWGLRRSSQLQRQRGVQSLSQRHWGERDTEARGNDREDEVAPFHSRHAEPPNEPRFSCGRSASHFRILRSTETEAPASCKRELGGVLDNGSKATRTFLNQKVPAATAELSPSLGVDGMVVEAANLADALPATRADKCVVRHTVLNHVV